MNIQPSSRFAVSMHTKTSHPQFNSTKYSVKPPNKQLKNLAEKYRRLVTLEDPGDNEQEQLEKILKLAVFDIQLNELLVNIDEQLAKNIVDFDIPVQGLSNDFSWNRLISINTVIDKIINPKDYKYIKYLVIGTISVFGAYIISHPANFIFSVVSDSNVINPMETNFQRKDNIDASGKILRPEESGYKLSNASDENHDSTIDNSLGNDIQFNWQQAHLFEKEQLEFQKRQHEEEERQHEFEKQQLNFERKQKQADVNKSPEEAQKYKDIAQWYKSKAAQSLALSKEYKFKAEKSLAEAQMLLSGAQSH